MIDWNRNGKIDPVDIGISIAIASQDSFDSLDLMGYLFPLVQEIDPDRNVKGQIRQYMPHVLYEKRNTGKLHKYGAGPFCRFSMSKRWRGVSGVYAICDTQQLLYIGQCVDFAKRFNAGYGIISPRNCYEGGQLTNCKINAMILRKYLAGEHVYLYFYKTSDYDRVERILISKFQPPYNGRE
ncbi:MAG: GIY-YIG nuclease family protein [Lentisphaerae bacterium]|nr:GIY-YIG nuclease family protein [Lentisphaerota bacterium]